MSLALFSEIKALKATIKGLQEAFEILAERIKELEKAQVVVTEPRRVGRPPKVQQ